MDWKRILIGKWSWKRPFYSLASIYALLALFAVSCADRIIFVPPAPSYTRETEGFRFVSDAEGAQIATIHFKAAPGKPTLIYSHGNAEDIGQNIDLFRQWSGRGLGVIAYDYPGYGLSPGRTTEKSSEQAVRAAWDYAISSGIPASSLILVGRSVGTGPSVHLASAVKPAGLVLISPFRSAFAVAIPTPFPILPGDLFPNLNRIRSIHTPLLVIHGEEDSVIPFSHGVAVHDNSPSKDKTFLAIPAAGHNDLFQIAGEQIVDTVGDFAERVGH